MVALLQEAEEELVALLAVVVQEATEFLAEQVVAVLMVLVVVQAELRFMVDLGVLLGNLEFLRVVLG